VKVYVALSHDCCGEPFCGIFATMDAAKPHAEEAIEEWCTDTFSRTRRWARWAWKDNDHKTGVTLDWPEEAV
jgi:hypothetical protein